MQRNIFDEIKTRVSAEQAARIYTGCEPNRGGFIRCPFHAGGNEKTPSLKFFQDGKFHCFGCGVGGTVIDFTALFF